MKATLALITLFIFISCNSETAGNARSKERSERVVKILDFIKLNLQVNSYRRDSIIVQFVLENTGNNEFKLYKPLLPSEDSECELFSILEKSSHEKVSCNGGNLEGDLIHNNQLPIPISQKIDQKLFITLQPHTSIELSINIGKKYNFEKFLSKRQNDFFISYAQFLPYIVEDEQATAIDSVDKKRKHIYYFLTMEEKSDPDSMRVMFRIP
jgi:hypothetical protein